MEYEFRFFTYQGDAVIDGYKISKFRLFKYDTYFEIYWCRQVRIYIYMFVCMFTSIINFFIRKYETLIWYMKQ